MKQLLMPILTVFIASACLMVIELTAVRIVAPYLGTSIYTWSGLIGVILAGLSLGGYWGGNLSDRLPSAQLLSILFILASVFTALIPIVNKMTGMIVLLWSAPLFLRVLIHSTVVFLLPAVLLGAVVPALIKFSLDKQLPSGKTVGEIYAASSAGSIVGTLLAGFALIPHIKISSIILGISGVLALFSLFYATSKNVMKRWPSFSWAAVLTIFIFGVSVNAGWAQTIATQLGYEDVASDEVIHSRQSLYSHIDIVDSKVNSNIRNLIMNRLLHSVVDMENPGSIDMTEQYTYLKLYGMAATAFGTQNPNFKTLVIGGGGYVFPRYLNQTWPGSEVEVVEIDPAVTEVAEAYLGLSPTPGFNIYHEDARIHLEKKFATSNDVERDSYDIIFSDAISGLSVPYELTTREFHELAKEFLSENGIYAVTIIDSLETANFFSAMLKTLESVFEGVRVFTEQSAVDATDPRNTFILMSSSDSDTLNSIDFNVPSSVELTGQSLVRFREKANLLTDEYAPVDTLLMPAYEAHEKKMTALHYQQRGDAAMKRGDFKVAEKEFIKALEADPSYSGVYNNLGSVYFQLRNFDLAKENFDKALTLTPNFAPLYVNLAAYYSIVGNEILMEVHLKKALALDSESADAYFNYGGLRTSRADYAGAEKDYLRVIELKPIYPEAHEALGNVLFSQGKMQEAGLAYEEALKQNSKLPKSLTNLGVIWAQSG